MPLISWILWVIFQLQLHVCEKDTDTKLGFLSPNLAPFSSSLGYLLTLTGEDPFPLPRSFKNDPVKISEFDIWARSPAAVPSLLPSGSLQFNMHLSGMHFLYMEIPGKLYLWFIMSDTPSPALLKVQCNDKIPFWGKGWWRIPARNRLSQQFAGVVALGSLETETNKYCPLRWLHIHQVPRNRFTGFFWILNTKVIYCNVVQGNIPEMKTSVNTVALKEGPQACPERSQDQPTCGLGEEHVCGKKVKTAVRRHKTF